MWSGPRRARRRCGSRPTGACSWPRSAAACSSTTRSPTRRRRCSPTSRNAVHDFWDRGLLGMALDPDFTNGRPFVYVLYTYNKDPSNATFPRWADSCPTPPGATADGCVVSGRLSRLDAARRRDAADHRLVPAVPEPLDRRPRVRPRPRAVRVGRRRRVVQLRRLRAGRRAGQPVRRPAGRRAHAADRGGRRAAQPGRPHRRPTRPAATARSCASTPTRARRSPTTRTRRSADPMTRRIVALRLPQPVPAHAPAGHRRGLGRRRGLERVGGDRPHRRRRPRPSTQPRLALLRGRAPDELLRQPQPVNLCETLYAQGTAADGTPHYTYRHADKVIAGEACPSGTSSVAGLAFYTGTRFPARYRDGLFFADYSRSCIWFMPAGANGLPDPAQRESFGSGLVGIVNLAQGPDGDALLPGPQQRRGPADQLRRPERRADRAGDRDAEHRRRAARGPVRRHDVDRPERRRAHLRVGPRRRRRLRRLDGRAADAHVHDAGHASPSACA